MFHIKILTEGKTKEAWLDHALAEYLKRLRPIAKIEFQIVRNTEQLQRAAEKERRLVCLDVLGKSLGSEAFADLLYHELESGGSQLTFVIGGADGLPESMRQGYPMLSLSPLTLTHQMVRLLLVEQIYRATEIKKGSRYHK